MPTVKSNVLMELCLSVLKHKEVREACRLNKKNLLYKAPHSDCRLTVVAQCELCGRIESIEMNYIWEPYANMFRGQFVDVLPAEAPTKVIALKAKACEKCLVLLQKFSCSLNKD